MGMNHERGKDAGLMATNNIIPFPRRHRGDPEPRRFALVTIGFRWCEGAWRRGRVVVTDADIDTMLAPVWERCLRRWTRRRPRARG
jgi:hypothetical protein